MAYASTVNANTDLWKLNKWYRGIRKSIMPALKRKDNTWASDSKAKADLLLKTWFPNMHSNVYIPPTNYPTSRPFLPVTDEEIRLAFKNLSNTSAPGLSGLGYKVLKWAMECEVGRKNSIGVTKNLFSYLLKTSRELGFHHPRWKTSLVVAIPKPGKKDYTQPRSHSPIQLIECMGKLVEKIVTKCLLYKAGKFDLMPFNQFGGRSNASCTDAGLSLIHDIHTARHKGLVSSMLTIDIKGFFDHVNHKRMVHVLRSKGFPEDGQNLSSPTVPSRSELTTTLPTSSPSQSEYLKGHLHHQYYHAYMPRKSLKI